MGHPIGSFQDCCLKPLGHASEKSAGIVARRAGPPAQCRMQTLRSGRALYKARALAW
ncbi:hypothetical protein CBM2606_A40186 [Cupriavidus taiwanensis]|nr:hypothetical protein CBM2606_A40186 [Cupriavidus taiwanensis]